MSEDRKPGRIAVNVMRARLTVVGFNLTIIALQLGRLGEIPGGVELPTLARAIHIESSVALLTAMGLSVLAMIAFIVSCDFDFAGTCDHWTLLAGDLLMYAGLAHSVAGFFGPVVLAIDQIGLDSEQQMATLATAQTAVAIVGAAAWLAAMYVGPAVSLLRSPFGRPATLALAAAYLVLVVLFAYVSAQAVELEIARDPKSPKPPTSVLKELFQPLRW